MIGRDIGIYSKVTTSDMVSNSSFFKYLHTMYYFLILIFISTQWSGNYISNTN